VIAPDHPDQSITRSSFYYTSKGETEQNLGLMRWIHCPLIEDEGFCSQRRQHSALGGKSPALVYWQRTDINQPDQQVQRVKLRQILSKDWGVAQSSTVVASGKARADR